MVDPKLASVLRCVESLYEERLRSYALWTRGLPLVFGALAVVPAFAVPKGYVLTLAIWGVVWTFRSYHLWKLQRLVNGPIVGVCGQLEEVGSHGRGHRRSDGLVYPVTLQVWFEGKLPVRRSTSLGADVTTPPEQIEVRKDDEEELIAKSEHWYRQLKRCQLERPDPLIVEFTRSCDIALRNGSPRQRSETFWVESSVVPALEPGEVVGLITLADGTVAVALTNHGVIFPRFMPAAGPEG